MPVSAIESAFKEGFCAGKKPVRDFLDGEEPAGEREAWGKSSSKEYSADLKRLVKFAYNEGYSDWRDSACPGGPILWEDNADDSWKESASKVDLESACQGQPSESVEDLKSDLRALLLLAESQICPHDDSAVYGRRWLRNLILLNDL